MSKIRDDLIKWSGNEQLSPNSLLDVIAAEFEQLKDTLDKNVVLINTMADELSKAQDDLEMAINENYEANSQIVELQTKITELEASLKATRQN